MTQFAANPNTIQEGFPYLAEIVGVNGGVTDPNQGTVGSSDPADTDFITYDVRVIRKGLTFRNVRPHGNSPRYYEVQAAQIGSKFLAYLEVGRWVFVFHEHPRGSSC